MTLVANATVPDIGRLIDEVYQQTAAFPLFFTASDGTVQQVLREYVAQRRYNPAPEKLEFFGIPVRLDPTVPDGLVFWSQSG